MKLYNSLNNFKEEFKPQKNQTVGFYVCGPTAYDIAHIGNLRTYVFEDLLKRTLIANGFSVKHVMNITDVDDKTIKKGKGKKDKFKNYVKKYEELFFSDCKKLNIIAPDIITRPTEYIDKMVDFIEDLIAKNFAYKSQDGSVYFSIEKFKDYGKLSNLDKKGIKVGKRINQDEYTKDNPADFALWKAWEEKDGEIFWDTSLGKGRPGWHIECSTMATEVLGPTIDIHAGAVDLLFPHHENEIAQSEAKTGKQFVKYWVHGEHLLVNGKKMSKSLNNYFTLKSIIDEGNDPMDFRYLILGSHYRSKLNFTWESLKAAKNTRERLLRLLSGTEIGSVSEKYLSKFMNRINDDLDTPGALAVLWEMMRNEEISISSKNATFNKMNDVLGLRININDEIPEEIKAIIDKRIISREQKDYEKSDQLRDEINKKGWEIEDLPDNKFKLTKS